MGTPDFNSPFYPYEKLSAANTMRGSEKIPHKLLLYLLDLPDAAGYVPRDDNDRARVRLAKYLWYDEPNPLSRPLPTPDEKLSMLFDPENPDINSDADKAKHTKGYRLFFQKIIGQSQLDAQTMLKCYVGRVMENRKYFTSIGIRFEIFCNVNLETNTKTNAYQRSYDIEQCLHEALDGVNMAGIGTISFCRADHGDNGSGIIYDEATNFGRTVNFSILWSEGTGDEDSGCGGCG